MTGNSERLLAWGSTTLTCLFIGWTAATLSSRISPFESTFHGLNLDLPTATRVVIATSRSPLPLLGGIVLVLVLIAKEFITRNRWSATCVNFCAFIVVDGLSRFADV